jgi:hypothetical protein
VNEFPLSKTYSGVFDPKMLWQARKGSNEAAERTRSIMSIYTKPEASHPSPFLLAWALSSHVKLEDLLDDAIPKIEIRGLDPKDRTRVTQSPSRSRILALVEDDNVKSLTEHLGAGDLALFLDAALRELSRGARLNRSANTIFTRVDASALLAHLLPRMGTLSIAELTALHELRASDSDRDLRVSLALAATRHQGDDVRKLAGEQLLRDTGSRTAWKSASFDGDEPIENSRLLLGLKFDGVSLESSLSADQRAKARLLLMELGASW